MGSKNLKKILDEGGYIDYRNVFRDLEDEGQSNEEPLELDLDETDPGSELPEWLQKKWRKYDMKDWE